MQPAEFNFSEKKVSCYFDASFSQLQNLYPGTRMVVITDDHIRELHAGLLASFPVISFTPGEDEKIQSTADNILQSLIGMEADRDIMILGVGGGVVTDMAGYVASVYKRGVRFGLVPTSLLGMVDAAIGGKNGINRGLYKNIIGTIHQPEFILYDYEFLKTLSGDEWINGFAEVIKHACIRDEMMFRMLERHTLHEFQSDLTLAASLIETNVRLKMEIVTADERDTDIRLLLNFGHTVGHAVENLHGLPHGHAVSIGMVAACTLSEKFSGFHFEEGKRIVRLLQRYHLPVDLETDPHRVFDVLKLDKKREGDAIRFVLLEKIGKGIVKPLSLELLRENLPAAI